MGCSYSVKKCLHDDTIESQMTEMEGEERERRTQLPHDLRNRRYWKLKEGPEDLK